MPRFARLCILASILVLALSIAAPLAVEARRAPSPVILVDLAHGEGTIGLCTLFAVAPEAHWVVLVPSKNYKLPECWIGPAEVWVGDFASVADKLRDVDMIIIGQPTKAFSDDEIKAIADWFKQGGKVLWCAGDSDYPAQGGVLEIADHTCDDILKAIGSKLRLDFVSIEDTVSNAGKPYRVVALVKPDNKYGAEVVAYGAEKVLFHGPGAVAWVDSSGKWHKLTESGTPENLVKIVVTTNNGRVVEHQPKGPGQPGEFGKAHKVGETGVFVLMAAEIMEAEKGKSIVIVSGESPYGGYQPIVTYKYHGRLLDGPRFVRNVILWALGLGEELKAYKGINKIIGDVVQNQVKSVSEELSKMKSEINNISSALKSEVDELRSEIASLYPALSVAITAAIIGIIAIGISVFALMKAKAK